MFNLQSVLENLLTNDLLIIFQFQWVSILLEARWDIESYLLFMSFEWFMSGKSFVTISSNPH